MPEPKCPICRASQAPGDGETFRYTFTFRPYPKAKRVETGWGEGTYCRACHAAMKLSVEMYPRKATTWERLDATVQIEE